MDRVTTKMLLAASPARVWRNLKFFEDISGRPRLPLRLLLSLPLQSEGDKLHVGGLVRCTYQRGHLVKRITDVVPAQRLRFEVLEQKLGIESLVRTVAGSYRFEAVPAGTRVELTTEYVSRLWPRFLWRPVERLLGHGVHRHILRGMRDLLASTQSAAQEPVVEREDARESSAAASIARR